MGLTLDASLLSGSLPEYLSEMEGIGVYLTFLVDKGFCAAKDPMFDLDPPRSLHHATHDQRPFCGDCDD